MGDALCSSVLAWHHALPEHLQKVSTDTGGRAAMTDRDSTTSSAHYWLLSGVLLASVLYSPAYSEYSPFIIGTARDKPPFLLGCVALWAVSKLSRAPRVPTHPCCSLQNCQTFTRISRSVLSGQKAPKSGQYPTDTAFRWSHSRTTSLRSCLGWPLP